MVVVGLRVRVPPHLPASHPETGAAAGGQEALPEAFVHEAVGDGVDAGGEVGQQEEGGLEEGGEVRAGGGVVYEGPGGHHVQGRPADEVLQHHLVEQKSVRSLAY